MYLRSYLCCLILLLPIVSGCSISTSSEGFSKKTRLFLSCMNQFWDYENRCNCRIFPKGHHIDDYCSAWTNLRVQGYNVPLDIPN